MAVPSARSSTKRKMSGGTIRAGVLCALAVCAVAIPAAADEIRLKDGKKLYGVIVAYEDNMFKIKTDFGYVLVEKDKIASIVPTTPAAGPSAKTESKPAAKKDAVPETVKPPAESVKAGSTTDTQPKAGPAMVSSTEATPAPANANEKSVTPSRGTAGNAKKPEAKKTAAAEKPSGATIASAAAQKAEPTAASAVTPAPAPAAPIEPEIPANREEIQGNSYINYTHGFRMYKAPSWSLIEDARRALPNAIVAMGTSNESTLLVIGQEKTTEPLDAAAATVEKRLHDVYDSYQRISQRKTAVGGLPAVEYHYRGVADGHAWSGTLMVVARGTDILTVLGMTYADTDLIQIQENVIARSIASLDFNAHWWREADFGNFLSLYNQDLNWKMRSFASLRMTPRRRRSGRTKKLQLLQDPQTKEGKAQSLRGSGQAGVAVLLGGGGFGGVGVFAMFADDADESLRGARKAAVAAIDQAKFAPEIDAIDIEEFYLAGFYLIPGKTFTDEGNARVCADETFDHADAGEFHGDVQARTIGAEKLVENLAREASARQDHGLGRDFFQRDLRAIRKRVARADHETHTVAVDMVDLEVGRLGRQGHNAYIDGAIFDALQNFVAEVAVDTDVHQRIAALEFRENVGEKIEAGGFIGAEEDRPLHDVAAIGNDLDGFVAQPEQALGVFEEHFARGRKLDGLGRAIQQFGAVGLFKLANLRADRGLRAKNLLARTGKAF
jgi:hypothetical protein